MCVVIWTIQGILVNCLYLDCDGGDTNLPVTNYYYYTLASKNNPWAINVYSL